MAKSFFCDFLKSRQDLKWIRDRMSLHEDTIIEEENDDGVDATQPTTSNNEYHDDDEDYVAVDDDGNLHIRSNGGHFQVGIKRQWNSICWGG